MLQLDLAAVAQIATPSFEGSDQYTKIMIPNMGKLSLLTSCLYSSVAERQSCKLKALGSIPSGGLISVQSTGASRGPDLMDMMDTPIPTVRITPVLAAWYICVFFDRVVILVGSLKSL